MENKRVDEIKDQYIHEALVNAHKALSEKGYDAAGQLMEYLFTDDPSYLTTYMEARQKLEAVDREELMKHILRHYFEG